MITKLLTDEIEEAASVLRRGGLVAVPTETVYGLAGNGLDPEVIEKIYALKGRPPVKPISLMVSGPEQIQNLCEDIPPAAKILAECFWPGPLTLVLHAKCSIPTNLRAGGPTVGLRCPRQKETLRLLRTLAFPLAVPSANPSGEESPKTADEVLQYFDGKIEAVIDGGRCDLGKESTVLDLSVCPFRILRQGSLPAEEIADALVSGMLIVGITGPSGSGKTTLLHALQERGAMILDADRIYHELLDTNETLTDELDSAFPGTVMQGKLQRKLLREEVFRDPEALKKLNGITHRHVSNAIRNRLRSFAMEKGHFAAIDAIGLIESDLAEICSFTVAVIAPEEQRIRRIMLRDGLSRRDAELRVGAQQPESWYINQCDAVIRNDGDLISLQKNISKLLEERINCG